MFKNPKVAFATSAVAGLAGVALTLDWSAVVSPSTAGVILMIASGAIAVLRALHMQPPGK